MINKDTFAEWLEIHAELKPYSIERYSNAINIISSELDNYGLRKEDLFNQTNTDIIDTILNNVEFKKKNDKGNRMYSAALKYLKKYIEFNDDMELQVELFREEQEFEKYLIEDISDASKLKIEEKPLGKASFKLLNSKKIWCRNPRYASEAVADANYLCEFDNKHKQFISKFSGKNYVEAHHLIPMRYQGQFDHSLDIHANIVSICLVCHKKIHFGLFRDKKVILDKLFNSRKDRLVDGGITIDINQLYNFYQD